MKSSPRFSMPASLHATGRRVMFFMYIVWESRRCKRILKFKLANYILITAINIYNTYFLITNCIEIHFQINLVEVENFFVKFNLGSDTITRNVKYNGFRVFFDATNQRVSKSSRCFWICPNSQLLKKNFCFSFH